MGLFTERNFTENFLEERLVDTGGEPTVYVLERSAERRLENLFF